MACVTHFAKNMQLLMMTRSLSLKHLMVLMKVYAIVVQDEDDSEDENQYLEFRELSLCHGGMVASAIRVHSEQPPFTKCTQTTFANL